MMDSAAGHRRLRTVAAHVVHGRRAGAAHPLAAAAAGADEPQPSLLAEFGFEPDAGPTVRKALSELEANGYTVLTDMISDDWLRELRHAFDALYDAEGRLGGLETMPPDRQQELRESLLPDSKTPAPFPGIRRLGDLVNKGSGVFDGIWQHPTLISIVAGVLPGAFKLHSLNGHDPLPGEGHQGLHADWGGPPGLQTPREPHVFGVVNSAWCLDEFTAEVGATRLVPGSHRVPGSAASEDADESAIQVAVPAGSVIIWNGSTWHGGCTNKTDSSNRRAVHCAWLDRRWTQQTNQREYLR